MSSEDCHGSSGQSIAFEHRQGKPAEASNAAEPVRATIQVIVVHYRSRGMLLDLIRDVARQSDVDVDLHVVECGDDGSVASALEEFTFPIEYPGENLGYCSGNNLTMRDMMRSGSPICLINPDVRLPDPLTLLHLSEILEKQPGIAAVAPSIRTGEGYIEYTGSKIDLTRACAIHTGTHVRGWNSDTPPFIEMPWIDGACWMLRSEAVREVGLLDEQFFLFSEDVDWCIRARQKGWRVGVLRDSEVRHERSSSFGNSTKVAYYAWRNSFLLCKKHEGYGKWTYFWLRAVLQFTVQRRHIRSGMASAALRGARDAIAGRTGRMDGDE